MKNSLEIPSKVDNSHFSSQDSLKSSHPIIVPIKHAEEVEQVFDAISYCKGSTVVNMVAAIIGNSIIYSHYVVISHINS